MYWTIGAIARETGIAPSAIRYYEQIGLLPEPDRINGRRRYEPSVLWRLTLIQRGKRAGLTLGEIGHLLHGFPGETSPGERWQAMAGAKLDEINRKIAELEGTRAILAGTLDCACPTLAECASQIPDGCS